MDIDKRLLHITCINTRFKPFSSDDNDNWPMTHPCQVCGQVIKGVGVKHMIIHTGELMFSHYRCSLSSDMRAADEARDRKIAEINALGRHEQRRSHEES
jgi:hypothetical protein